jgi:hypothetical protein
MCRRTVFQTPVLLFLAFAGWAVCSKIAETATGLPLDDAYIFKRYALNLAAGMGFSFNPGQPSFGNSSFLWTALLALLVKIFGKAHYFGIAQASGIFFTAASLYLMLRLLLDYTGSWLMVFVAALLAWFSGVTFMNAISGMENGLFAFLVLLNIYWFQKYQDRKVSGAFRMGVLSALTFLTRPEGLYFAAAIAALLIYKIIRQRQGQLKFLQVALLVAGFGIVALPFIWWLNRTFHQLMPFTFLAKIYGSSPGILGRTPGKKFYDGLGFLVFGWRLLIQPWIIVGWVLGVSALCGIAYAVIELVRKRGNAAIALIAGWMFLPFVYGFKFPVSPFFGGYYQRNISTVWLIMILLGLLTMNKIYLTIMPKLWRKGCLRRPLYLIGFILMLIYCIPIAKGQVRQGKIVYKDEVRRNQGLRLAAADWIDQNTPKDARILVGYTGLGVVGGECNRHVYDIGALINPDLLPYLKGTAHMSEKRWQSVLLYVCAKNIDYFVSFAPVFGPDPAQTPGFTELVKIGVIQDVKDARQQIRIYKIDRAPFCAKNQP